MWTRSLPSEQRRESAGFASASEDVSVVFLNRSVLFLTSCSFDIPHALTSTDTWLIMLDIISFSHILVYRDSIFTTGRISIKNK